MWSDICVLSVLRLFEWLIFYLKPFGLSFVQHVKTRKVCSTDTEMWRPSWTWFSPTLSGTSRRSNILDFLTSLMRQVLFNASMTYVGVSLRHKRDSLPGGEGINMIKVSSHIYYLIFPHGENKGTEFCWNITRYIFKAWPISQLYRSEIIQQTALSLSSATLQLINFTFTVS